jgi:hypothetical protein
VEHLKSVSLGLVPALSKNTILFWKALQATYTLAYWAHLKVTKNEMLQIQPLGLYSHQFIFLVTYEWAIYPRVLH